MKQYIMICDENGIAALQKVLRADAVQFLEVQGMNMGNTNQYNILVTPVLQPLPSAAITEAPTADSEVPPGV